MKQVMWMLLIPAVALAAPDPGLLEKGRAFENKGKHAEAISAYEEYLKAAPDDAVANAELGFAALQAKDLVKAEAATRKAIARAPKPTYPHDPAAKPLGAALYNLGLILEAQGKPKDAAQAYKDSLAARSSKVVREKLQKLDAGVAATADALAPAKLAGPFKDLQALCVAWLQANKEPPDTTWGEGGSCSKPDPIKISGVKLGKPFEELRAFQLESRENLEIAVRLADGWYHFEYVGAPDRSSAHCGGTAYTVKQLPLASTAPQLQLAYTSRNNGCDHGGNGHSRSWGWDEKGIIAIGIGASGTPSAPRVLPSSVTEWQQYDDEAKLTTKTTLKYAWGKDGALDVTGNLKPASGVGDELQLDADDLLGHHTLVFP
jgi:tetratricopeptide (TPR) repeat protein